MDKNTTYIITATAEEFEALNPVLKDNEVGKELHTDLVKFGDGETAWNDLPYFGGTDFQLEISENETAVNNDLFRMNMVDTYFTAMYAERDIATGTFFTKAQELNIQGIDHSGPSPAHYGHVIPGQPTGSGNKGYNGVIAEIEGDGHSQLESEFEVYYEAFDFDFMEKAREFKLAYGCAADYEVNCMHGTVEETEWAMERLEPEWLLIAPESNLSAYADYFPNGAAYETAAAPHITAAKVIDPTVKVIIDADPNDAEWNAGIASMDADAFKIYWKPDRVIPWDAVDFESNFTRLKAYTDTDFPALLDFLLGQFDFPGAVTQRAIQVANAEVDVRNTMFECLGTLLYHQWVTGYARANPTKLIYSCEMNCKQLFNDNNTTKANFLAEKLAGKMYGSGKMLRNVSVYGLPNIRARAVRDGSTYYVLLINLRTTAQTITGIKIGSTVHTSFDQDIISAASLSSSTIVEDTGTVSEVILPARSGAVIQINTA